MEQKPLTFGQRLADKASATLGSWRFLIIQTVVIAFWICLNSSMQVGKRPDPYPFMLLNFFLSLQAAYAAPMLLISANRQSEIDRARAIENLELDHKDHKILMAITEHLDKHLEKIERRRRW